MESLTKLLLFLFLLLNIICITLSMDTFHEKGKSSGSEDDEIQNCKLELATEFKHDSGIENFLHALLNQNTESYSDNEQGLKKKYYDDLFESLRNMNIPSLMHPEKYCYAYQHNREFPCMNAIDKIGCGPKVDGLDCLKHMYLAWKDKDESILGTKHLSDLELRRDPKYIDAGCKEKIWKIISDQVQQPAIYARKSYPNPESVDEELKKAFYDEFQIEYVTHENLNAEYLRREKQPKPYEKKYAIFLHKNVKFIDEERGQKNSTGSAFKNCQEFCDHYFS